MWSLGGPSEFVPVVVAVVAVAVVVEPVCVVVVTEVHVVVDLRSAEAVKQHFHHRDRLKR